MEAPPTQLHDWLYLGSEFNAASRLHLIERNITAILQSFFFFEWPTYEYASVESSVNAADDDTVSQFGDASEWIAYLVKYENMTLLDAARFLKERRPGVRPHRSFLPLLVQWEREVKQANSTDEAQLASIFDALPPAPTLPLPNEALKAKTREVFQSASQEDINGWLVPCEHHAAGRVALFESLHAQAVAFVESLFATPATKVTRDNGATLLREADALRAEATKFTALPGAASIGEQATVALVSDEQSVTAVCLVIDAIIRNSTAATAREELAAALRLLRLCKNQDYVDRRLLVGRAQRLLTLPQGANEEAEKQLASYAEKLGREWLLSHLALLQRDVSRATGMCEQFQEVHRDFAVSIAPIALHSYWWPPEALGVTQAENDGAWYGLRAANWPTEIILPPEVDSAWIRFVSWHREQQPGVRLRHLPNLGTAVIRVAHAKRRFNVTLPIPAAGLDLRANTEIGLELLREALQTLTSLGLLREERDTFRIAEQKQIGRSASRNARK